MEWEGGRFVWLARAPHQSERVLVSTYCSGPLAVTEGLCGRVAALVGPVCKSLTKR